MFILKLCFDYSEDGNTDSQDVASGEDESYASEANNKLNGFWPSVLEDVKSIKTVDIKNQNLPLTRIKKIMKLDEDVKMISAEAPILFAKAAEIFIHELTLRAWVHTENNRRRTLQRNDIAMAITKYDQFDFLIDIVPRDEIKTKKETDGVKPTVAAVNNEQEQYFLQLAQALQTNQTQQPSFLTGTPGIQLQQPVVTQHQQQDNNILHATTNQTQQQPTLNVINNQMLLQQVVSPTGEITNVPVNQMSFWYCLSLGILMCYVILSLDFVKSKSIKFNTNAIKSTKSTATNYNCGTNSRTTTVVANESASSDYRYWCLLEYGTHAIG